MYLGIDRKRKETNMKQGIDFVKIIETKFIGPTNTRGSRIVAQDSNKNKITVNYEHSLSVEDNHVQACHDLLYKLSGFNPDSMLVVDSMGSSISGKGFVFSIRRDQK